jgi:hypothetical protein
MLQLTRLNYISQNPLSYTFLVESCGWFGGWKCSSSSHPSLLTSWWLPSLVSQYQHLQVFLASFSLNVSVSWAGCVCVCVCVCVCDCVCACACACVCVCVCVCVIFLGDATSVRNIKNWHRPQILLGGSSLFLIFLLVSTFPSRPLALGF